MKAAVLEGVETLRLKDVDVPRPVGDLVLVRVVACGICMTDYKAYSGDRTNVSFPTILGHEFSGIVEEVGNGAGDVQPGDEVIVSPVANCGTCPECRNGMAQYCRNGAVIGGDGMPRVLDGAFAELVAVPANAIYRKPKSLSFEAAALTEPLAGAYKGLVEYSGLGIGEDLVIIGAGSMGLLAAMIAARAGAATVILVDVEEWRLSFSRNCGATHVVNARDGDAAGVVAEIKTIIPDGPDVVFEAAGTLPAARLAFDLCRRGTRVNMFGVTTEGTIPVSPARMHWMETRVDASFSVYPRAMLRSIRLQERGIVDAGKIITHRFRLAEINDAMDTMRKPERVKVIVKPGG